LVNLLGYLPAEVGVEELGAALAAPGVAAASAAFAFIMAAILA
jgi:hypothetical protein